MNFVRNETWIELFVIVYFGKYRILEWYDSVEIVPFEWNQKIYYVIKSIWSEYKDIERNIKKIMKVDLYNMKIQIGIKQFLYLWEYLPVRGCISKVLNEY